MTNNLDTLDVAHPKSVALLHARKWTGKMNPNLASGEAIKSLAIQVTVCLEVESMWPQISAEHGRELLREIRYWRTKAGLLPKSEDST